MSEIKLLPCPFCGAKAAFEQCDEKRYYVYCTNENCNVNRFWAGSKDEASTKWNSRVLIEKENRFSS